jgi:hypothetical protein
MEKEIKEKKGVPLKVFGVCLFLIGSLTTMLHWRGGMPVSAFNPIIMVVGVAFFIIGTIRGLE